MAFRLAVYDDEAGLRPFVWREDDGAIPQALAGLDPSSEVYFFGLGVGHWCHLRLNSGAGEVSPAHNLLKTKVMAEREGFEPPVPFRVRRFSRPEPSTTRPPLRLLQG